MSTPDRLVAEVLSLAEGKLVGRVRLQKVFYLLESLGLQSGLSFHYHHYGPYSQELDSAIDRAKALHGVREEIEYRQVDGMPFSTFTVANMEPPEELGALPNAKARSAISLLKAPPSTVVELAATIHWLAAEERVSDWRNELVRRKGAKASDLRVRMARDLLRDLSLAPEIWLTETGE